jgi:hypothetical protein
MAEQRVTSAWYLEKQLNCCEARNVDDDDDEDDRVQLAFFSLGYPPIILVPYGGGPSP